MITIKTRAVVIFRSRNDWNVIHEVSGGDLYRGSPITFLKKIQYAVYVFHAFFYLLLYLEAFLKAKVAISF